MNKTVKSNDKLDEIDLKEVFNLLYKGKLTILAFTLVLFSLSAFYSLLLPNIYQSKALVASDQHSQNLNGSLKSYSNLASIAGISLPSQGVNDNSLKALKKMSTLSFFKNSILPNIHLPDLMAIESWDYKTNTIIYDKSIYDQTTDKWVREASFTKSQIPSDQESYEIFIKNHLYIHEDQDTGFVSISIKHMSPSVAMKWVKLIINQVNEFYREKDKTESHKAVIYLNNQLKITSINEIKVAIAELLQRETQKLSLIEANEFYVFEYIDPPAIMEKRAEPNRILIIVIGIILGAIFGIVYVFINSPKYKSIDF